MSDPGSNPGGVRTGQISGSTLADVWALVLWANSEMYSRVKLQLFIIYTVVRILNKVLRLFVFASHVSIGLQRRQTQSLLAKAKQACRYDR